MSRVCVRGSVSVRVSASVRVSVRVSVMASVSVRVSVRVSVSVGVRVRVIYIEVCIHVFSIAAIDASLEPRYILTVLERVGMWRMGGRGLMLLILVLDVAVCSLAV